MTGAAPGPESSARDHPDDGEHPDLSGCSDADAASVVGRLFDVYRAGLQRYLARRIGPTAAEDVVAETFLAALRSRRGYDPARGGVRSWLYGIAANLMRQHERTEVRALRATARLAGRPGDGGGDHAEAVAGRVDAQEQVRQLAAALSELTAADRELLLLASWADLTATEIGLALGVRPVTVRTRLHRIRRRLRARAPQLDSTDRRNT
jgi:RNA polymerase sigma-70 factor (ECF subfamily)